jgi:hypothetical protein
VVVRCCDAGRSCAELTAWTMRCGAEALGRQQGRGMEGCRGDGGGRGGAKAYLMRSRAAPGEGSSGLGSTGGGGWRIGRS